MAHHGGQMIHHDGVSPLTFSPPPPMPPMVKSIRLMLCYPPVSSGGVSSGRPDSANPLSILLEDCFLGPTPVMVDLGTSQSSSFGLCLLEDAGCFSCSIVCKTTLVQIISYTSNSGGLL